MKLSEKGSLALLVSILVLSSSLVPTYAEVTTLRSDFSSYHKGDVINFSGTVDKDSSGLVTIVIRDSNDEFVLLSQSIIQPDSTYENAIEINEKFVTQGVYNVTAFIFNLTGGATTNFNYSFDEIKSSSAPVSTETKIPEMQKTTISETEDSESPPVVQENQLPKDTTMVNSNHKKTKILLPFVDGSKDPQYYLDRYYNEPNYKAWFDRNYPNISIEEAVGAESVEIPISDIKQKPVAELINGELIQEAEASSISESINNTENNSEIATMSLAIGGIGILFAAVYGIKRKVDNNSFQISQNRATIKKKLLNGILNRDPVDVIRDRLAKGEITLDEFNRLMHTLKIR